MERSIRVARIWDGITSIIAKIDDVGVVPNSKLLNFRQSHPQPCIQILTHGSVACLIMTFSGRSRFCFAYSRFL